MINLNSGYRFGERKLSVIEGDLFMKNKFQKYLSLALKHWPLIIRLIRFGKWILEFVSEATIYFRKSKDAVGA